MKEGWTCLKLWEVCEVTDYVANGSFATLKENVTYYNEPNYAILVRVADFSSNFDKSKFVYVDERSYKFLSKSTLYGGEIIMSNVGSVGKCFICPDLGQPMTIGPNSVLVRTPNSRYFYYYFQSESFQKKLKYITNQTTLAKFNKTQFRNLDICIPSPKEQDLIVSRLDAAFAKIDALKANAERQLSEARKLFQAELTECMKPKEGWEEKKFNDICSFVRGPFGGSLKKECFVPSGYAVYEQQNAIYNKFTFRYFVSEEKYKSMIRFSVNPGDLIMSCSGTIGKVSIVPEGADKGIINQALLKLTPRGCLDKHYLKYLMDSSIFEDLISQHSDGAAIKNIASVSILKDIILIIPPLSEQQAIVEKLDALSENVKKLEEIQQKTIVECDALKQALLREVFSEE